MGSSELDTRTEHLEKVLASQAFAQADRLRDFLRFIVEQTVNGEASFLKETVIGVTVFGRSPGYDPKLDNIVRTSARRVRLKLDEYYGNEGAADSVRIELPKGSYVPFFQKMIVEQPETFKFGTVAAEPTSAFSTPVTTPRFSRLALFSCVAIVAAAGLCWIILFQKSRQETPSWHSVPFTSSSGYHNFTAFSPDGSHIAFSWAGPQGGPGQVYVQSIGGMSAQRLTDSSSESTRPAWSPDGRQIAFVQLQGAGKSEVHLVEKNGQNPRLLSTLTGHSVWLCNEPGLSWSPSGTELTTVEASDGDHGCGIVVIDVRSGKKRWLIQPPKTELAYVEPAFSPDGKWIAFLKQASAVVADLFVVPATGGNPRRVTSDEREVRGFAWSQNGKELIASSRRQGNFLNLWRFPLGRGGAVRMTEGPLNLGFPSTSKTGDRLAYVAYRDNANIWRSHGASNQVWIESSNTDQSPQYSPDGRKIAFVSDRGGNLDLWLADANGRNPIRLTELSKYMAGSPAWSPDSRRLAFDVQINGQSDIYLIDAEPGHKPDRLTTWPTSEVVPSWSHDGRFVYFASLRSGLWNVYRAPATGGEPTQITHNGGFRALESSDGKFVYFTKGTEIRRTPLDEDKQEEVVLANLTPRMWPDWAIGRSGIYYLSRDPSAGNNMPASIELLNPTTRVFDILGACKLL